MSCFICCNITGMGCPCCVDQFSGPVIDCKHDGHDWKNPCGQCLYNAVRNMNVEEEQPKDTTCDECGRVLDVSPLGVIIYYGRGGGIRWCPECHDHPSLWQRFKNLRNVFK
jgi:hypothetical protein